MKPLCVLVLLIFLSVNLHAQVNKGTVLGKVIDKNGLPLQGVTLIVAGSNIGTVSDADGNYFLIIPPGHYSIMASSVGYHPTSISINPSAGKKTSVFIKLLIEENVINGITVLGQKIKSATATRTLLPVQDVPQSLVVVGQTIMQQQAAFDLTTITRNVSGINFTGNYSGAGSSQFFNARGFDLSDYQNYRWNGMMIWNLGNNYWDNIEQVEFLKGPSSILYGDVAPGGVMNFVTKKPTTTFFVEANIKTGSWGLFRPSVDIGGPINKSKTLRYRLNTSFEKSNSFRDNVSSQKEFIAPTIAWDINPKLSLNIEVVYKKSRATDDAGLVSPDGAINGLKSLSPSLYLGEPQRNYLFNEQDYFATLTYYLNNNWRMKTVAFYGNTTNRPFGIWFDQPDSVGNFARRGYGYYQKSKTGTLSAEAYGTLHTGAIKHNFLFGAEYQAIHYRYTNEGSISLLDTNNINNPVNGVTPTVDPPESPFLPYVSIVSRMGLYVQDQLMLFNNKLQVLIGTRLGATRQGNHYYPDELPQTPFAGFTDNIITKTVLTPRVGLVYKPTPRASVYASYSTGYEVNSADIFAKNYQQYRTPPATISSQVEIGTKTNLLNDQLGLSVSVFQIDKHNPYGYVYLNPTNPNYNDYNVYYQGHHQSRGFELDVDGKILSTLSLTAGGAYTKTNIDDDPGYPTGNSLPNAPRLTGNFWLNYEPSKKMAGFSVGTGLFYKGSFFSSLVNDPNLQIPASYTLDAAIGYQYNRMGIQINAMNLTNQVSYLNPWQFNLFDVKPLRQFIITLKYRFEKK